METPADEPADFNRTSINAGLFQISAGSSGGSLSLPVDGSPEEIYGKLVIELQRYAGHAVQYFQVQTSDATSGYPILIEYEEQATALYAGELAAELLNAIMVNKSNSEADTLAALQQALDEYVAFALPRCLDPNSRLLIQAANRHNIPLIRLDQPPYMQPPPEAELQNGRLQLGWGIHRQRCMGPIAEVFASQETLQQISDLGYLLPRLRKANIPIAAQDLEFVNRNQIRRAQRSARRIGYPVTLRPKVNNLFQYRLPEDHVFGPLHNDAQVGLAASYLREKADADIWVESHVEGKYYRFLILDQEVLSVVRCSPPTLIGDGIHTITELARLQAEAAGDPVTHRIWYKLAQGDRDVMFRLQLAGLTLDSVPEPGVPVALRRSGTAYNGGSFENVTNELSADYSTLALQVATLSGIGALAGVEMIIDDLSGPPQNPNCTVTHVTPAPDLHVHEELSEDNSNSIGDKYLSQLFPAGHPSRIPTVAVTGTNGKTTTSRMVARILSAAGLKVGLACSDGIYLDHHLLHSGDESGIWGANDVLMNPKMEAAVLETARGGMARYGIAFDRCNVGVCLNIAEDHLGQEGIETLDEMAVHKQQVIERTTDVAVLNAEDPRCLSMREHTEAKEVILIAYRADHPAVRAHCQAGGRAVVVDTAEQISAIALAKSGQPLENMMTVDDIPATIKGAARHNVYNALFAAATCLGLGIQKKHIIAGLKGFEMGVDSTPGRLNEIPGFPFKVLVDAAHNVHGFNALVQFTNQMSVNGKKIIIFGARGEFPDSIIREFAAVAAGSYDFYILTNYYMGQEQKERTYTEVPEMLKQELLTHGVSTQHITIEPDILAAVDIGLGHAHDGDLLTVLVRVFGNDKWKVINKLKELASN